MYQTTKTIVFWLVVVFAGVLLWSVVKHGDAQPNAPEVSFSKFINDVEGGQVKKVTISGSEVTGTDVDGKTFRVIAPPNQVDIVGTLHEHNVEIWFRDPGAGGWPNWLMNLAPLVLLGALWFFMIRTIRRGQAAAKQAATTTPVVTGD